MKLINAEDIIFVAGKGMVGTAIVKSLKKNGYKNLLNPSRSELDLLDINAVQKWFSINRPNVVIISAAKVGGIIANSSFPGDFILENLKIQTNIIETAWRNKVKRLLFLGSSCIYPKHADQPIKEEQLLSKNLEESNESYAIAKIAGLKLCSALRKQYEFDAITLMPTNLYGPGDNYKNSFSHVLPGLIRRFHEAVENNQKSVTCWGTGTPLREFLHVNDLANACVFALERWDPNNKNSPRDINGNLLTYLNVGTGKGITIKELATMIAKECNFDGEIIWDHKKPDGTPIKILDISRINSMGWESTINLKEGIKITIKQFKNELKENLINSSRY